MAFSEKERRARHAAIVNIATTRQLKAVVLIGDTTVGPDYRGDYRYYVDNRITFNRQVAVVFPNADPVVFTGSAMQQEACKRRSIIKDCRNSTNMIGDLIALFRERNIASGKIGVGMEMLSTKWYLALREALPGIEWVETHDNVLACRYRKSAEEMDIFRRAAAHADEGFDRALKVIRPGKTEHEIVAEIEFCSRAKGGEEFFSLIASGPFTVKNNQLPLPYAPSTRKIEHGDSVVMEISPRVDGYWTQLVRTVNVGKANDQLVPLFEAARGGVASCLEALKPGNTVSDLIPPIDRYVKKCGLVLGPPLGHVCDTDLLVARVDGDNKTVMTPGTAIIIHPTVFTPDLKTRFFWGETYMVTENGYERLHKSTDELLTV